jgi:CobQ-like glutamine amidotransferase family enzyme
VADSTIGIALLFPELLGTYGDFGNALVLLRRLQWRGHDAAIVDVPAGTAIPEAADLFVVGGGEDAPQVEAADELIASGAVNRAVDRGAAVLAVCAGFQIIGTAFPGPGGPPRPGVGLIDATTVRGPGPRAVGEIVVDAPALPTLTGFENHGGHTRLGAGVAPLGRVTQGVGNGDGTEGVLAGNVVGTYLHGPVLARNPALADLLLARVVGDLDPLDDAVVDELRAERLAAVGAPAARARRWRR